MQRGKHVRRMIVVLSYECRMMAKECTETADERFITLNVIYYQVVHEKFVSEFGKAKTCVWPHNGCSVEVNALCYPV